MGKMPEAQNFLISPRTLLDRNIKLNDICTVALMNSVVGVLNVHSVLAVCCLYLLHSFQYRNIETAT